MRALLVVLDNEPEHRLCAAHRPDLPRLLNYIVALYLILVGVMGLFGVGNIHIR